MAGKNQNIAKYPKSSFYWGMKILERKKRDAMFTIYAFCKEIDNIGDKAIEQKRKKMQLKSWRKEINKIYKDKTKLKLGKSLKNYIEQYKLKKEFFIEIIKGVEMDINNQMIAPTKNIFNLYCYRVAGAVGLLCLNIFGENNKNSRSFGVVLANAFQITNILRDIKEDSLMGRLYIPKEILQKAGIKENDIKQIIKNKKFPIACKLLAQVAESNFKIAEKKLKQCNENKLKSAILMMQTYKLLLKKLKKEGWKNIGRKVYLTKLEKITLFLKVSFS